MNLSFRLTDEFVSQYIDREVPWGYKDAAGNAFSEIVFLRTYSRLKEDGTKEQWWEVCRRVIEGMFSIQKDHCRAARIPWNGRKAHASAEDAFDRLFTFKWTPPGRGLWMMGTPLVNERKNSAALQNPLHEDTKVFVRDQGWVRLGSVEGQDVELLSSTFLYGRDNGPATGGTSKWVKGNVSFIETQPSIEIKFTDVMGQEQSIVASRNHRWFVATGSGKRDWKRVSGEELKVGDYLPTVKPRINYLPSVSGQQHGFFFGDGSRTDGEFQQFGSSVAVMARLFGDQVSYTERYGRVGQNPLAWGFLPEGRYLEDQRYVFGFLSGYFAADGCVSKNGTLSISSARQTELEAVAHLFGRLGIETTQPRLTSISSNYLDERELWTIRVNRFDVNEEFFLKLEHKERWLQTTYGKDRTQTRVKITSITEVGEQRVLCASVPEYEQFVTEGYVLTSNCSFVSTGDMDKYDPAGPFAFLMEASMLGVGVGFDTKGADKDFTIYQPTGLGETIVVPDSREGWVDSLRTLLEAYLRPNKPMPVFDYSEIRPAGMPIKTFGGTAAGADPLMRLHSSLAKILDEKSGQILDSRTIADIGNLIGVCVVSGNVRRSAELLLGEIDDESFLNLKDFSRWNNEGEKIHEGSADDRQEWGWMSNNSVSVEVGQDLSGIIDGIALNGEPGVVWMDLSRKYGRLIDPPNNKDHRAAGYNPCAEQTLESFEMCVSGDTMIQTETGMVRIDDVVDTDVRVWNGKRWSTVRPFYTGRNSLYRVTLSDGSYLDATAGHEWQAKRKTERAFKKFKTTELEVGMSLPEFSLVAPDGKPAEYAYAWGWVAGDGYIDGNNVMAIVKCDEYSVLTDLGGVAYKEQSFNNGSEVRYSRVNVSTSVPLHAAVAMRKEDRLPDEVFGWDIESIANFVGAWIDTDGSVIRQQNTDHYVLYGSEGKLRQLQMLLRRIGVDHATLRLFAEKGSITNKGVRTHDLYRLLIPSYEAANVATKIKVAEKFGARTGVNNAHADSTIDRARKQKIVSVELISEDADTYCFNEPEEHMGVFGNVLTHQCTLVETYLNRHESLEDYKKTLKVAYLYGKTVTLLPTHWERTNAIMLRNRRIGTSASGIANFADNRGLPTLREWQDQGYAEVQRLDKVYSEWLCVRESIKTTTVKPSGTVSILAGESPGVHWSPGGEYFNRAVRFSRIDPMVKLFAEAGYTIEDAVSDPTNTVVVYFPIHSLAKRSEADVTLFEKASLAAAAQRYWSDNSVSVTLSFDPETEADHVGSVLGMYEGQLKTVSFLPMIKEGAYPQMPYTGITQEQYEDASASLWPVDLSGVYLGNAVDAVGEQFCTTDVCEVKEVVTNS